MKAAERRKAIVTLLLSKQEPIPGSDLAKEFQMSRQIIVQDIAVLKGQDAGCGYHPQNERQHQSANADGQHIFPLEHRNTP